MTEEKSKIEKAMIRFLSDEDVRKIHEQTLTVLGDIGVTVEHDSGRAMLADAGAKVDPQTHVVRIPSDLVERSLKTAPKRIVLGARDPDKDLVLKLGGRMYARNGGGPGHIVDMGTGKARKIMTTDVADYARLVDALDHIDYAAPVYAQDTPPATRDIRALATIFANTVKHINMRVLDVRSLPYVIKMAEIVAGGKEQLRERPLITMLESPIAPLKIPGVLVDTLVTCGEYGIPVEICSMPNAGATGPITLAGSLLMSNVEMLAAVVISQFAHPAAPLEFAPRLVIMDMASGRSLTGSIENALLACAGVQLARECYQIPVNMHGPYTDSVVIDSQSAIERTYFTFLPAFAGANVLAGAGHLEQGLVISFPQLLIDDEIHGLVNRALEGFEVNDDTLAMDAIVRSMAEGNFLMDVHTLKHLRMGRYIPHLLTRDARAAWEAAGSKNMAVRAKERAQELLKTYQPAPLNEDVARALDEVVVEAARELEID
jgi:trimethylamine--corrinoid protein Co-methyltransferase